MLSGFIFRLGQVLFRVLRFQVRWLGQVSSQVFYVYICMNIILIFLCFHKEIAENLQPNILLIMSPFSFSVFRTLSKLIESQPGVSQGQATTPRFPWRCIRQYRSGAHRYASGPILCIHIFRYIYMYIHVYLYLSIIYKYIYVQIDRWIVGLT